MRIGHCQLEPKLGDFKANLEKLVGGLERADRERVEVVCFPECFLTGYPDQEALARQSAFAQGSAQFMEVLDRTSRFEATFIVASTSARQDLTCTIPHSSPTRAMCSAYSKCTAYMPFHKQGREFPCSRPQGVKFGVVICADGGYIEPSRILAIKGAKIIFSPHFNYIGPKDLINHFMKVRSDHVARAVENNVSSSAATT
jgi:predicted amidohydrolase